MAPSLKMISLAAALVAGLLLFSTPQVQGWATNEEADMVPAQSPAEHVLVAIPGGGVGTQEAPFCLQCRCCSKSSPANCQITSCCSSFKCNPAGKCNLVQDKCGCGGCGGAN